MKELLDENKKCNNFLAKLEMEQPIRKLLEGGDEEDGDDDLWKVLFHDDGGPDDDNTPPGPPPGKKPTKRKRDDDEESDDYPQPKPQKRLPTKPTNPPPPSTSGPSTSDQDKPDDSETYMETELGQSTTSTPNPPASGESSKEPQDLDLTYWKGDSKTSAQLVSIENFPLKAADSVSKALSAAASKQFLSLPLRLIIVRPLEGYSAHQYLILRGVGVGAEEVYEVPLTALSAWKGEKCVYNEVEKAIGESGLTSKIKNPLIKYAKKSDVVLFVLYNYPGFSIK